MLCLGRFFHALIVAGKKESENKLVQYSPFITWSHCSSEFFHHFIIGAQWLSGRVLTQDRGGHEFETHRHHCVVSLSNTHLSLLSTVSPQEDPTHPDITEKMLIGT